MLANLDLALFRLINLKWIHPWADRFFVSFTSEDFWLWPLLSLIVFLLFFHGRRGRLLFLLLLISVSLTDSIAYRVLKPGIGRLRPCKTLEDVRVLEKCGGKYSMPSNHAANFFAAATLLSLFFRRARWLFFSIAFLAGAYARVYVGKHWPGDVLAGALFGVLTALAIYYLWVMLRLRLEKQERYFLSLNHP